MNEIRNAIVKAANLVEQEPGTFNFMRPVVPSCGTPGCALGWIGHFLGVPEGTTLDGVTARLDVAEHEFYERMRSVDPSFILGAWVLNAECCAAALRAYAEKYHPAEEEQYPEVKQELDRIFGASRALEAPA